jgi:hypothetical protein
LLLQIKYGYGIISLLENNNLSLLVNIFLFADFLMTRNIIPLPSNFNVDFHPSKQLTNTRTPSPVNEQKICKKNQKIVEIAVSDKNIKWDGRMTLKTFEFREH